MKHKPRPTPTKRSTSFSLQSTASAGKFKLLGTTSGYLGATQRYYCTVYDYKDRDAAGDWHGLHAWAAEADETGEQNVQKMSKAIGVMLVMSVVNLGATCETTTTTIVNKKKVR